MSVERPIAHEAVIQNEITNHFFPQDLIDRLSALIPNILFEKPGKGSGNYRPRPQSSAGKSSGNHQASC